MHMQMHVHMHVRHVYPAVSQGWQREGPRTPMAPVPHQLRAAARQHALKNGHALPAASPGAQPGYPITTPQQWDDARQAVGRVKDPQRRAALGKLLRKTAPMVGRTSQLSESWAAPGTQSHANTAAGVDLAVRAPDSQGFMLTCPECSYSGPANRFGANGAALQAQPGLLRTPTGKGTASAGMQPGQIGVRATGHVAGALANENGTAIGLATGTLTARRHAIRGPMDVLVARNGDGTATLKHRNGGADIAGIRKTPEGKWVATVNGTDLQPRDHQRMSIMEAVGAWNGAITSAVRPREAPLQGPPQQTDLMREYGIPAIRALATPVTGAGDGPRVTTASGSSDDGGGGASGLGPRGQAIYRKLIKRGFTPARALAFAQNAGKFGGAEQKAS
jgi:hypothetical protein